MLLPIQIRRCYWAFNVRYLKGLCHKDIIVLGQISATVLHLLFSSALTHTQNASVALCRRYQTNFIKKH